MRVASQAEGSGSSSLKRDSAEPGMTDETKKALEKIKGF